METKTIRKRGFFQGILKGICRGGGVNITHYKTKSVHFLGAYELSN